MKITWTMRAAHPTDAHEIALHRYYRGEPAADVEAYAAWLPTRIERGTYLGFVAETAGAVVAGAGAALLDWGPTRGDTAGVRARIFNVYTAPAWQRQGIASSLVRAVMAACTNAGVRTFSLAASPEGAAMYAELGFEPYPEEMILRVGKTRR
jgi:GNAT superfamily N-acetyltransferase